MKTWVLVADSSRARIFTASKSTSPIVEFRDLVHSEGRQHEREITSDLPGHNSGASISNRHAMGSETDPLQQEAINFSREINQNLDQARLSKVYDRLIVVAAPAFLGLLREHMSPATSKLVAYELNKDLTKMNATEIRKHLPERLPRLPETV